VIENDLFVLLVDFLLLPQNDVSLPLNRTALELGVLKDVRNDVNGLRHILAEALGIIDSLLSRGIRVEMCTKVLHLKFQSMLCATIGALKSHVLEEMSSAIGRV